MISSTLENFLGLDVASLSDNISIVEIAVQKKWIGKTLRGLDLRKNYALNVIAIKENNKTELVTNPDIILGESTRLVVIASKTDIEKLK